jgi:hypothetical protein
MAGFETRHALLYTLPAQSLAAAIATQALKPKNSTFFLQVL